MVDSEAYFRQVVAVGYEEILNPIHVHALIAQARLLDVQQGISSYSFTIDEKVIFPEVVVDSQTVRLGTVNGEELIFWLPALQNLISQTIGIPTLFNPVDTRLFLEKGENRYGTKRDQLPFTTEDLLAIHIISLRMQWLALCASNPDLIWVLQAENVMSYDEVVSLLAILPSTIYPTLRNQ